MITKELTELFWESLHNVLVMAYMMESFLTDPKLVTYRSVFKLNLIYTFTVQYCNMYVIQVQRLGLQQFRREKY